MPLLEDDLLAEADEASGSSHKATAALGASLQIELDATAEDEPTTRDECEDSPGVVAHAEPSEQLPRIGLPVVVEFPRSSLINPRSAFAGYEPPLPVTAERVAVEVLRTVDEAQRDDGSVEFELDQFSIYTDRKLTPLELRPLHHLTTRQGHNEYLVDGILRAGDRRFYVKAVPFHEVPIGNYGTEHPTVGGQLWIRSVHNKRTETYYRLKKPAVEYRRYHDAFLWVANLTKHVIDYCEALSGQGRQVSIHSFRSDFSKWLHAAHEDSAAFRTWWNAYGKDDFRSAIVANKEFLWKEYYGIVGDSDALALLWSDIRSFNHYKAHKALDDDGKKGIPPTIVTPYIYDCFGHMQVGQLLKNVEPSVASPAAVAASWPQHPHTFLSFIRQAVKGSSKEEMIANIKPGDTISTHPDDAQTGTKWKSSGARWFGLVQEVHHLKESERSFDITWLYRPIDTPCCSMRYPYEKELFLSDHCTCLEGSRSRIHDNEVLDVHTVEWFGSPNTAAEFFVRQTYTTEERRFVTLQQSHLACDHTAKETPYRIGDTVLAPTDHRRKDVLEPCIVAEISQGTVTLQRLLRRRNVDPHGRRSPPNELVLTNRYTTIRAEHITGRCVVGAFRAGDKIPTPYDRGGTGNLFFVTRREVIEEGEPQYAPIASIPWRQGFNPSRHGEKLRSMDLFCGCGNFGRGLEEGGAIEYRWANDIWDRAIHTYMANAESPGSVHPFVGSVDDMLRRGLEGEFSDSVPRPGEVDLISGGSPCPGFSLLTANKATLSQLKNRSLVASFAAFIDFYRPKYGILENVPTIVQVKEANRKEDFFSQLICAIVGMGYQAQIIQGDAWSHGSAQQRVRAFLYFAAPGVPLPAAPPISHSHPPKIVFKALGEMANGLPYVQRELLPTAFEYVSALEAVGDLPDIAEGKVDTCVPFPDHRLCITISSGDTWNAKTSATRKNGTSQIRNIPLLPYGLNFAQAWNQGRGIMRREERDAFPEGVGRVQHNSKAWGRLHPHRLFSTITTFCHYQDARVGGRSLHWQQQRPITLMEARRAQGIPDDEVLVGDMSDQWRMVGNSVDRHMALALGLKFREAWLGTLYDAELPLPVPAEISDALGGVRVAARTAFEGTACLTRDDGQDFFISEDEQSGLGSEALDVLRVSPDSAAAGSTPATSISDTNALGVKSGEPSILKRHLSRAIEGAPAKRPRIEPDGDGHSAAPAPGADAAPRGPTIVRLGSVGADSDSDFDGVF